MTQPRRIALEGSQNLRDIGGYITPEGPIQTGRFLRADGLHHLSPEAQGALSEIALVVDLRHAGETQNEPNPLPQRGISYVNISVFEGLDPANFRPDPSLPDNEVLLSLYRATLLNNGPVFVRILNAMAEAPEGPILFHCTAGKDRTGLVAMFLMGLAGASRDDIISDYALTESLITELVATLTAQIDAAGKDGAAYARRFLTSKPETMAACLDFIDLEFGGILAYLLQNGLGLDTAATLKARLLR